MADEVKTIAIRPVEPYTSRVLLYERDERHPNKEAFVVSRDQTFEVAETSRVIALLERKVVTRAEAEVPVEAPQDGPVAPDPREDQLKAYAEKAKKDDLVADAEVAGVELADGDTKLEIVQKLDAAGKLELNDDAGRE